jgi:hypothetical protein
MIRVSVVVFALLLVLAAAVGARQSVRVVDVVKVATPGDESVHHLSESDSIIGTTRDQTWRSAAGWFSYSLRIYDDSPLTLVCVLADGTDSPESFDVLVDGQRVAWISRQPSSKAGEFKKELPLTATAGRTSVTVKFVARPGSRTARILEVRSVQEHLE